MRLIVSAKIPVDRSIIDTLHGFSQICRCNMTDEDYGFGKLPVSFGKQDSSIDLEGRLKRAERPEFNTLTKTKAEVESTNSAESDFSDDDDEIEHLPISHQLIFCNHTKPISSLSCNGPRFVSGGFDNLVKFWDFNGMDPAAPNPFRSIEPIESHQVHRALFSPSGKQVLILGRYSKPVIYSNDGTMQTEFVSGDMYLVDMKNTKGHIAEISCGEWNPTDSRQFATGSVDSTIRIWDVDSPRSQKCVIIVRSSRGTAKTKLSSLCWTDDGQSICATTLDGELKIWDTRSSLLRPSHSTADAHTKGTSTSGICCSSDNFTLATRGRDDTIKLWDTRKVNSPLLSTLATYENTFEDTNIMFSPDGKYIVTGSSSGTSSGYLNILDKSDLAPIGSSALKFDSPVTQSYWSKGLDQILVGLANGHIYLLFNPRVSKKGAMVVLSKQARRRYIDDNPELTTNISIQGLTEGEDYMVQRLEEQKKKKAQLKQNQPKAPNPGVWGIPTEEHLDANVQNSKFRKEDPREELLRFAERAETDPMFKHTRVKKIFADIGSDEDANDSKRQKH